MFNTVLLGLPFIFPDFDFHRNLFEHFLLNFADATIRSYTV